MVLYGIIASSIIQYSVRTVARGVLTRRTIASRTLEHHPCRVYDHTPNVHVAPAEGAARPLQESQDIVQQGIITW